MKHCIFVLAHQNNLVFEKVLIHLSKYTTPKIPKFIILNNCSPEVRKTALRYQKEFKLYYYTGINYSGLAIDHFISENKFDFYFKIDDDVMVATENWNKRLMLSYSALQPDIGFVSCLLPIHCFNWVNCIKILKLEDEFHSLFPYRLDDQDPDIYKKNFDFFENLQKNFIDQAALSFPKEQDKYKSFSHVYYKTPIWYDKDLTLWLWKKVLENKLKPVNKIVECEQERYSICLIGFSRELWQKMAGFGQDDEFRINNFCKKNQLKIISDYSVIAHHFSYSTNFDFLRENFYPLIKEHEF